MRQILGKKIVCGGASQSICEGDTPEPGDGVKQNGTWAAEEEKAITFMWGNQEWLEGGIGVIHSTNIYCAELCPGPWGYCREHEGPGPCSHGAHTLVGRCGP